MKVLITGASGMVGRNLVSILSKKKYHLLTPPRSQLNLLDYSNIENYLLMEKPDFIIHAAGRVGGIQANISAPLEFYLENLEMGKNLIVAARKAGILRVLNLSSSCIYPPDRENSLVETDLLSGGLEKTNEGYALAKLSIIKLCEYLSLQDKKFEYKTIIPCNLYGRYDKFDESVSHMIPAVIKKIHNAKMQKLNEVEIWGDGTVRREFMYVEDLARLIEKCILEYDNLPQLMNIGLGYDYSINDYYQIIAEIIGYDGEFKYVLDKPVGMKRKLLNVNRMKSFDWVANTTLEDGIRKTYQYFLELNGGK
ncbi:GDP-L-fucose synthase family protein [Lysinibacillus fusiformis]|uniref:GDP-L-fucose synthase family protein n=1 Tax=Lysinibacillus fusiformis TaxID=28031 RepID=UPI003CFC9F7E